jgi:hypothetical protein
MTEETQACDSNLRNGKLKRIVPDTRRRLWMFQILRNRERGTDLYPYSPTKLNFFFKELTCFVLTPESGVIPLPLIVGVEASQSVSVT